MKWHYSVYVSIINLIYVLELFMLYSNDSRGRDRMMGGFTASCAISALSALKFEPRSCRCVLDTTLCDTVCQWLALGWWFSLSTPLSSINKTDRHDIAEILMTVVLNTITITHQTLYLVINICFDINLLLQENRAIFKDIWLKITNCWKKKFLSNSMGFFLMLNCITFVQSLDCQMWW